MSIDPPRVLILTADAGFGHRSAANAIAAAIHELNGEASVEVVNALEHPSVPRAVRDSQSDYDRIVRDAPGLYKIGFRITDDVLSGFVIENSAIPLMYEALRDTLREHAPDVIVLTWPLYQAALKMVFAISRQRVPVITVITDLMSVHRLWFHQVADVLVAPTAEARQLAIDAGIPKDKIRILGIPVNPRLGRRDRPREAVRESLGWQPNLTTVFAVGSARAPRLGEMLRGLNHSGLPIQLIVSAGKSAELLAALRKSHWHLPTRIYPFVEDMPTFLHASDIVICKAGGLMTTEALAAGLPIIFVDVIPGQEEGNARYVVEGRAGVMADTPLDVLETVCDWLAKDGRELRAASQAAARLGKPHAARDVAQIALDPARISAHWRADPAADAAQTDLLTRWLERLGLA